MKTSGSAKPATAADVARRVGVSAATVSYVLNDVAHQSISAQTRAAVLEAAAELGYRPNLVARNLRLGGSGVVLYVVPRMPLGEVLIEVASRLTAALSRHGIVLSLQIETSDAQDIIDAIHNLRPIAVTSVFPLSGPVRDAVSAAGLPQAFLGSSSLRTLSALNRDLGRIWVQHLMARGHRRLAFAYSDDENLRQLGEYWLAGLRAAAASEGLPEVVSATLATDAGCAHIVAGWHAAGVTAVCAQTDLTALVALGGIRESGLQCPRDLAVIGADAGALGYVSDPPLTSVAFDSEAIAKASVAAILAELGYPPDRGVDGEVFATLVARNST